MTPQEMQARSAEKVKEVMKLMELLHVRVEVRKRMDEGGFITDMVFWIDEEKYPAKMPASPESTGTGEVEKAQQTAPEADVAQAQPETPVPEPAPVHPEHHA